MITLDNSIKSTYYSTSAGSATLSRSSGSSNQASSNTVSVGGSYVSMSLNLTGSANNNSATVTFKGAAYAEYSDGSTSSTKIISFSAKTSGSTGGSMSLDSSKTVSRIVMTAAAYISGGSLDYGANCTVSVSLGGYRAVDSYSGILKSNQAINLLDKTSVTGFDITGAEPTGTKRRFAFKIDDAWYKMATDGTLSALSITDSAMTDTYLLANGNTASELTALTTTTGLAGKLIYPAIAMYAPGTSSVMPTAGLTVKAKIDSTESVYIYTDYSQEYHLSDQSFIDDSDSESAISSNNDVPIVSLVAETETKGQGTVVVTARLKQNGEWTEYMNLSDCQMKEASAIQLKSVYTVQNIGTDSATVKGVTLKYNTAGAVTSNNTTDIVTITERFTNDLTYVHCYCKHKELIDAQIKAYCSIRKQPEKRTLYQFGNGTGALKTYKLTDSGINQDTLRVYVDGKEVLDFGYNTETSEITITADKEAALSASYEYGWEMSDWVAMEQGESQVNDGGSYTTEFTYVVPTHEGTYTVTAVKFELLRPEGKVENAVIGVGTGLRQIILLPHKAKTETIECNGKWSYDYDSQQLTIIAPEGDDIVVSYDWIAESPTIYSISAGWAD